MHWVSTPIKNTSLFFFAKPPVKPANCLNPPFQEISFYILHDLPWILDFSGNPTILKFFSLTQSHLLKVTKFLVEISQFKFLVVAKKNIFVFKLFFIIKYLRFQFTFHVKTATPLLSRKMNVHNMIMQDLFQKDNVLSVFDRWFCQCVCPRMFFLTGSSTSSYIGI